MTSVPAKYLGVWRRSLLTTGDGHRDTTTVVIWLQTQKLFADLRIPCPPPAATSTCLEDCNAQQMQDLAAQQGFAGSTEVVGDICTWNRELDYQPKSGPPDIGKMQFHTDDFLTEDDPSGQNADHEVWQRDEGCSTEVWSYRLQASYQSGRQGFLLGSGNFFFFVADRCVNLPPEGNLQAQLQTASVQHQHKLLEMELSFGTIKNSESPAWLILHSTLPGRTGEALFVHGMALQRLQKCAQSGTTTLDIGVVAPKGGWTLKLA